LGLAQWVKRSVVKQHQDSECHIGVPMAMNLDLPLQLKLKYQKLGIAQSADCQHLATKKIHRLRQRLNRTRLI
jgi:hypothetical protein